MTLACDIKSYIFWREEDVGPELFSSWKPKWKQIAKRGLRARYNL